MKAPQDPPGHLEAHQKQHQKPDLPDLPDLPGLRAMLAKAMLAKEMLATFALINLGNV